MAEARSGDAVRGSELAADLERYEAVRCNAFVACDVTLCATDENVVLVVMATNGSEPAAFIQLDCVHHVELIISRLREAAMDAFKDQPCTECEKVV